MTRLEDRYHWCRDFTSRVSSQSLDVNVVLRLRPLGLLTGCPNKPFAIQSIERMHLFIRIVLAYASIVERNVAVSAACNRIPIVQYCVPDLRLKHAY
jgi:hypothetical protein